jgi:hypothetical protein
LISYKPVSGFALICLLSPDQAYDLDQLGQARHYVFAGAKNPLGRVVFGGDFWLDDGLDRTVAIKILPARVSENPEARATKMAGRSPA